MHSEQSIFRALTAVFPHPAHTLLAQVRNGTGYGRKKLRTADALVVSTYPSRGLWLGGIEIKVDKSDWKREFANPDKAEEIAQYCHRWYVAAPAGIVDRTELPAAWGLIEVGDKAKVVVPAKEKSPKPLDMLLLCAIIRKVGESMVPKAEVDVRAEQQAKALEGHRSYELKQLKEKIAKFEEASGVSLRDTWNMGDIGQAVNIVRTSLLNYNVDQLDALRTRCEHIARECNRVIEFVRRAEATTESITEQHGN